MKTGISPRPEFQALIPPSSHPGNSYTETQSTPSPLHHLVWVTLERVGVEDEEPEE